MDDRTDDAARDAGHHLLASSASPGTRGAVADVLPTPDPLVDAALVDTALVNAVASAGDPVVVLAGTDESLRLVWGNRAFADAVHAEVVDLAGTPVTNVIRTAGNDLPLNSLRVTDFRVTLVPRVGVASSWHAVCSPMPSVEGHMWVLTLRPTGDGIDVDELLRASEERFRILSERAPIGIFSSEVGLRFGYVNDWFAQLVGLPADSLLGTGWIASVDPEDVDSVCNGLQRTLNGEAFEGPARLVTSSGEQRWVTIRAVPQHSPDSPASFLGTVEDVTDRRRVEELLSWQATHDSLTGLPNRSQLIDEVSLALARGADDVAVLFLDLDDFKAVNDTLGHQAGDELLIAVAARLRKAVREGDHVYRFAGDEFVVLARGASTDVEALGIANRLRATVAEPVTLVGEEFQVRCSAGVVRAEPHATAESLLRDADTAMYQAKRDGKGSAALFDPAARGKVDQDLEYTARIREAIAVGGVTARYRPIVALGAQPLAIALDASVTVVDDDGTELDPMSILEVARHAKLSRTLVFDTITQVCADLAAWREEGPVADPETGAVGGTPLWVSLAVTHHELLVPGLVDHVARALVRHRLSASDLAVRFVEEDPAVEPLRTGTGQQIRSVLDQLSDLGIRVSADAAIASLASPMQLTSPALAALHVDLDTLPADHRTRMVVRAIVDLAEDLHVDVIAGNLRTEGDVERATTVGLRLGAGPIFGAGVIAAAVPSVFVGAARP